MAGSFVGDTYLCSSSILLYASFWTPEISGEINVNGTQVAIPTNNPVSLSELISSNTYMPYSWNFHTPVWQMEEGVTVPRLAGVSPGWGETCTLALNVIGDGMVTGAAIGETACRYGQPVILDIAPESLTSFSHWVDDSGVATVENVLPHCAFIMEGNRTLTAVFRPKTPFSVTSAEDLAKIGTAPEWPLDGNYRLANDIDAAASRIRNDGEGFAPIGSVDHPFEGIFDGNGHVIANIYINRPGEDYVGVFACISSTAVISNLGVTGHVNGGMTTGGIVALSHGTIANCFAQCAVQGADAAGEIAGATEGVIRECWSSGNVRAGYFAGGIAAGCFGKIENVYSSAWLALDDHDLENVSREGGAIGIVEAPSSIRNNSHFAERIFNRYNTMPAVTAVFSTGLLSAGENQSLYGVMGEYNQYFLVQITTPFYDNSVTGPDSVKEAWFGRTPLQLTSPATFSDWDFETPIWTLTPGASYPHLVRTGPQEPQQLTVIPSEGGAVHVSVFDNGGYSPVTPPYLFETGTPVRLEAVPNEGYVFQGWAGLPVLTGHNESSLLFTLVYDSTISATFAPVTGPTPYAQIAEAIPTHVDEKNGTGKAWLWGVISPDVTEVRINGATLALNSLLCAETIYSTYTRSHISGMRKWTWLSGPLQYGDNAFTIEADAPTPEGIVTATTTRTVTVHDTEPPELTLLGAAAMTLECGGTFEDPGATAMDNAEGDLSAAIAVEGTVNTVIPGEYLLSYNVADGSGNTAAPVTRTILVTDTLSPALSLEGATEITLSTTETYTEPGFAAIDTCASDLASQVSVAGLEALNAANEGDYVLTYTVADPSGNTALPQERLVHVLSNQSLMNTLAADFDMADNDGDQALSFSEAATILAGLDSDTFASFDSNGDGLLDRTELTATSEGEGEEEGETVEPGGCCRFDGQKSFHAILGDCFMMLLGMAMVVFLSRRG